MSLTPSVLVTGAGGVLGTEVLAQLRAAGATVTGVTRSGGPSVVRWHLGEEPPPRSLTRAWDVVVHSAASTRWTMSEAEARRANIRTTEALGAVVGPETHLVHVSTAFALGLRGSTESPDRGDYRNAYEWSKATSERHVLEQFRHVTIVRPPLIIGRRSDGRVARFTGLYTFFRAAGTGLAPAVVADADAFLELAPVDDVAARIVELALGPRPAEPLIDVIGRGDEALCVRRVLELGQQAVNEVRGRHGHAALAPCPLIDPSAWERFYLPFARQQLGSRQLRVLDLLAAFRAYLDVRTPLAVTTRVADVTPAVRRSVRHWAEKNLRVALAEPRAWGG
jgi:nucleoside-diphosphate-sugar epimerase